MPARQQVAVETFVDNIQRQAFDNWAEHETLYGHAPIVEMNYPRALSQRHVPVEIQTYLIERARLLWPLRDHSERAA